MNSKVLIAFALVAIFATVSYGQPEETNDATATLTGSGGGVTAGLRHRRQYPYGGFGGFGGSNSFANANAGSSSFGAPGFGFGGSNSFANANAGSNSFNGGRK